MRIALPIVLCLLLIAALVGIVARRSSHGTDAQVSHRTPLVAVESVAVTPNAPAVEAVSPASHAMSSETLANVTPKPRRGVYDPSAKARAADPQSGWVCIPGTGVGIWPKATS